MRNLLANQCIKGLTHAIAMRINYLELGNSWKISELENETTKAHAGVLEHVESSLKIKKLCNDKGIRGMFSTLLHDTNALLSLPGLTPLTSLTVIECTTGPYAFCCLKPDDSLNVINNISAFTERVLSGNDNKTVQTPGLNALKPSSLFICVIDFFFCC